MHKTFYGEKIIPADKLQQFRTYRYVGTDHSLLYKYVYGPLAQFLVDRVLPPSLA